MQDEYSVLELDNLMDMEKIYCTRVISVRDGAWARHMVGAFDQGYTWVLTDAVKVEDNIIEVLGVGLVFTDGIADADVAGIVQEWGAMVQGTTKAYSQPLHPNVVLVKL